jgi:adenosylcobinamide amidohydrolase
MQQGRWQRRVAVRRSEKCSEVTSFMVREQLQVSEEYVISRSGRFLVAELLTPHRILSTSTRNGGQQDNIRYLVNHQSCEPSLHQERHDYMVGMGLDAYHDVVCAELDFAPETVAIMGTAANMNNVAIVRKEYEGLEATAVVTAGVENNSTCAGDPAAWCETDEGWKQRSPYAGTINTMLLVNHALTDGTLARAVITMAEAKSAALNRLAVRSCQSQDPATGTGTDQFCVAAPLNQTKPLTSASTHVILGELIGTAVRDATIEAIRWQNRLEISYTRSLFYALRSYGINEKTFWEKITPMLSEKDLELLKANTDSVFCDPLIASSAYALVAVLDRSRYGTLPANTERAALIAQTATLAVHFSSQPRLWPGFYAKMVAMEPMPPADLILHAISLGWSAKWTEGD